MKLEPQNYKLNDNQIHNLMIWVVALRSGDFSQGKGSLKRKAGDGFNHCCLGIACELNSISNEENDHSKPSDRCSYLFDFGTQATSSFPDSSWFKRVYGFIPFNDFGGDRTALSNLNDDGYSFAQIADVIETVIINNQPIELPDL